jgi:hypothetical protein
MMCVCRREWFGRDFRNEVANDKDVGVLDQLLVHAIEYIDICEENRKVFLLRH